MNSVIVKIVVGLLFLLVAMDHLKISKMLLIGIGGCIVQTKDVKIMTVKAFFKTNRNG